MRTKLPVHYNLCIGDPISNITWKPSPCFWKFAILRCRLYSIRCVCVSLIVSVVRSSGVSRLQYAIPRTCPLPTGIGTGEYIVNCSKYFLFNKIFFDKDLDQSGFWCHQNIFLPPKYFFYKSTWNISVCSNNYFGTQTSSGGAPGENTAS